MTQPKELKPLYICDHLKNTECKKNICAYNPNVKNPCCWQTTKVEHAVKREDGTPVEVPISLRMWMEGKE